MPNSQRPQSQPAAAGLGALVGFSLSLPWVGLAWLGHGAAGLPMVPFTLFELLTRLLPGPIVTTGLEAMIGALQSLGVASTSAAGKTVEQAMAIGLVMVGLTAFGALHAWAQQGPERPASEWALGLSLSATTALLLWWAGWGRLGAAAGLLWAVILGFGWAFALRRFYAHIEQGDEGAPAAGRRRFLAKLGVGSLAVGLAGWGAGRLLGAGEERIPDRAAFPSTPTPVPPPSDPDFDRVRGTRPELSPMPDFYRVDINLRPPDADSVSGAMREQARRLREAEGLEAPQDPYPLPVRGLVERPLLLSLTRLRQFPAVDQFATLECISNSVGGDLIDTTLFTGARLGDVINMAGVLPEAQDVKFTCADGYSESLPLESARDERTLLCYAMGGQPLAEEHGFPLRLYTPDRFGMKNPKWIVLLELVGEDYRGYWEQRGWDEQAFVKSTAVIDAVHPLQSGAVEVGGIAFAGARGVAGVELRLEGGEWISAELDRPISPLTWVLWRARVEGEPGRRLLEARMIDRSGKVQAATPSDTFPDGASGYHSRQIEIPA